MTKSFSLLVLLVSLFLFACTGQEVQPSVGSISARVDGREWTASSVVITSQAINGISFKGMDGANHSLVFQLSNYDQATDTSLPIVFNATKAPQISSQWCVNDDGKRLRHPETDLFFGGKTPQSSEVIKNQLIITHLDQNYIEGTFEFIGTNERGEHRQVTDGRFLVRLK